MLVHYYLPKGQTIIDGQNVYGIEYNFPPTKISYESYLAYKQGLILGIYTSEYLERIFGPFDLKIRFTYKSVRYLDFRTLQKLATYLGLESKADNFSIIKRIQWKLKDI